MRWARENDYDALVQSAAATYGVDFALIKAVIALESAFDPKAVGDDGSSLGLMQVQVPTAQDMLGSWVLAGDLKDPGTNISAGAKYLATQMRRAGSVAGGVSAYNGGYRPTIGFGATLSTGQFKNQAYVARVLANLAYFQSQPAYIAPAKAPPIAPWSYEGPDVVAPQPVGKITWQLVAIAAVVLGALGYLLVQGAQ